MRTLRSWLLVSVLFGAAARADAAPEPDVDGEVQVTSGAGLFVFSSVDLYSSVTTIPYVITGVRPFVQA